ncbi:MAG: hypothetical protein IT177_17755 [Acidobacteria bacterium]|nr:hypothetical protein [Acidobacteriota bacterium]
MAGDWAMEMQEALERFRQAFSDELRGQLLATEERLETRLSERLETRLSERLETRLSERLETRLSERLGRQNADQIRALGQELEQRLSERLGRQIADQMTALGQQLEQRLGDRLTTQLAEAEARLDQRLSDRLTTQLAQAEARLDQKLGDRLQVHTEELRDLVRVAAEGYGGTLERIERDLGEFRAEWRTRSDDTDRILAHHLQRIEALERATGLAPD